MVIFANLRRVLLKESLHQSLDTSSRLVGIRLAWSLLSGIGEAERTPGRRARQRPQNFQDLIYSSLCFITTWYAFLHSSFPI